MGTAVLSTHLITTNLEICLSSGDVSFNKDFLPLCKCLYPAIQLGVTGYINTVLQACHFSLYLKTLELKFKTLFGSIKIYEYMCQIQVFQLISRPRLQSQFAKKYNLGNVLQ
jgi:hypothetical protein